MLGNYSKSNTGGQKTEEMFKAGQIANQSVDMEQKQGKHYCIDSEIKKGTVF